MIEAEKNTDSWGAMGSPIVAGKAKGKIIGTKVPLSFWGGFNPETGEIVDRHHPLSGVIITGSLFFLSAGRGSSSGSGVLLEAIIQGKSPKAIILSKKDEIIALGAIVAEEVFSKQLPVILLTETDFDKGLSMTSAEIEEDGSMIFYY